jgi:citrate/tricarballylate utilization protein
VTQEPPGGRFLDGLFAEAQNEAPFTEARRQLTICNACRYCEGYCAVFPALERLGELARGDVTHLADLCHDCRDCYTACMYAPPHEFAVNVPAALSAVRRSTYDEYLPRLPWAAGGAGRAGRRSVMLVAGLGAVVLLALLGILADGSRAGTPAAGAGSPYRVIAYPALLVAVGLPAVGSALVMAGSAARYWRATGGQGLASPGAWLSALRQAASLRNLRGGGADCSYPTDEPSAARRRLHGLVAWGFACCAGSTVAAAISQDFAGDPPPYPVLSAPVLLGVIGGAGMVLGCTGLLLLRRAAGRADKAGGAGPPREDAALARRGYALLAGLLLLAVTGLLTLIGRDTPAFGIILAVHLATVVACFAIAPYTKFMHVIYRFLALVHEAKAGLGWSGAEDNGGSRRAAARCHGRGAAARPGGPRHVQLGPAGDRDRRGLPATWRAPLNRVPARRHAGDRGLPRTGRRARPVPARREAVPARRDRGRGRPVARGGAATAAGPRVTHRRDWPPGCPRRGRGRHGCRRRRLADGSHALLGGQAVSGALQFDGQGAAGGADPG